MGWTLRIRHPAGQSTLTLENEGSTTCTQLQFLIQAQAEIAAAAQELLGGFPPKPLQLSDGEATVASIGIANGDSLTVREKPAASSQTISEPAAAAAAAAGGPATSAAGQSAASMPSAAAAPSSNHAAGATLANDDEDTMLAAAIAASLQDVPGQQQQQQPQQQQHPGRLQGSSSGPAGISHPSGAVGQTPSGKGPAPTAVRLPDGSCVVRRVIPSDNSCLFTAVGYVMENNRGKAAQLRRVIADAVAADPVTYNEGFLGQENDAYQAWILDKQHWGGAIELSILSQHYGRVICAYDIQTKRCDRYNEEAGYDEWVMLIYDGLHYDALAVSAFEGAPEDLDITVLQVGSADAAAAAAGAEQLVAACHAARQFTDIANFTLRCGVCQIGLKGEKEAVEHAKTTGHQNFAEY